MPFAHGIEYERLQMIDTIRWRLEKDKNWLTNPPKPLVQVFLREQVDDMPVRKIHDKFGWMAKDTLNKRGLCAGSMYRSTGFLNIEQENRCGTRLDSDGNNIQTVHIEHTIPAKQLHRLFLEQRFGTTVTARGIAWLLARSIATGVAEQFERCTIDRGGKSSTKCLTAGHAHYSKPFLRCAALYDSGHRIFDIWRGIEIDPDLFTINDHFQNVINLFRFCGAESVFIDEIDAAGSQFP